VGFVLLLVVVPLINQTTHNLERAALQDDRKILTPSGSDLGIVGKWGDSMTLEWTGKNMITYEFNADGTYTFTNSGTIVKGKWGRLKGNNQLVTRLDSDTSSSGSSLRTDSSGKLFCDGFTLVKIG
jgi:hypothetical protein